MEHGFDQFLTVGTYVFFRKKIFSFINLLKIEIFPGLNSHRKTNFWEKSREQTSFTMI